MTDQKTTRPKARLPRGFRDRTAAEIAAERVCLTTIARVYESYGFEPLETPAFEYTDALGKSLPDVDRPNEGVFSLQDDDKQWLSLRYDLTAPLARYVAENFQNLPKPFRRYQVGQVWRNEKPGPGRYREFTQFDADTVGSASPSADAELLMMAADALEALGLKRDEYVIKMSNRKLLDGLLENLGRVETVLPSQKGTMLRAIDKLDRLGADGVFQLLTSGRKDESGDFTTGAELSDDQADNVMRFLGYSSDVTHTRIGSYRKDSLLEVSGVNTQRLARLDELIEFGPAGQKGWHELIEISNIVEASGYGNRVQFDQTIVRGLDYYTGPVFEAQLKFPVKNESGEEVVFGSVAGGGRYDDLVARFTGQQVPAVGISIGVSRLLSALRNKSSLKAKPLVFVCAFSDDIQWAFRRSSELRNQLNQDWHGNVIQLLEGEFRVRVEAYTGTKKLPDQLKYANKRGADIAVIEGSDERAIRKVTVRNLKLGAELSKHVHSRSEWLSNQSAQETVELDRLVQTICQMLDQNERLANGSVSKL